MSEPTKKPDPEDKRGRSSSILFSKNKGTGTNITKFLDGVVFHPLWKNRTFVWIFCVLCSAFFIVSIIPLSADIDVDSPSYYTAAKGIQKGINIYEEERFQSLADQTFGRSMIVWPFIYPPLTAQIFIPLALLNPLDYSRALLAINILATFLCLFLLAGLLRLRRRASGLPLLFLFSLLLYNFPLYRTLEFGQINMWVLACVLLSIRLDKDNHTVWSSFFLILAVFIKIFPVLFLVLYALQKRFRYVLSTILTGTGMILISVVLNGPGNWIHFARTLIQSFMLEQKPLYFFDFTAFLNNNSLQAFFTQGLMQFDLPRSCASPLAAVFLVGTAVLFRKDILGFIKTKDQSFILSILIILPLVLSSMTWQHHFVSLLVPFIYLFTLIVEKRHYSLLIPFVVLYAAASYFPPYGGFPFSHVRLAATILTFPLLFRVFRADPSHQPDPSLVQAG